MPESGLHAYVYYRIDPAHADLAAIRIDALLNTMSPHCGNHPRRLKRCDDATTWMEIYNNISDFGAFEAALSTAVHALTPSEFILGGRHMECFHESRQVT